MMTAEHLETALRHMQRIIAIAMSAKSPITPIEALEQIVEELDLAGFGALDTPDRLDGTSSTH